MKYSYSGLITVFVFCLIWQLLSYSSFVKPNIYFPPISTVLIITVKSILSGELLFHIAITLYRAIIGLVIALFLAIPLGILMGYYKKVHD